MNLIESLCTIVEQEGIKLEDRIAFGQCLAEAMNEGRFKFIERDGQQIGFIAWEPWAMEEGTAVYIHSLLILKRHMPYNLHRFVTFLRDTYPDLYKIYWHNYAKNERKEFILPKRELVHG